MYVWMAAVCVCVFGTERSGDSEGAWRRGEASEEWSGLMARYVSTGYMYCA
jgi:hypothetical protein